MVKEKTIQDKVIELEEKLRFYEESPLADGYENLYRQIERWNKQAGSPEVDLLKDETNDIKRFEKASAYFLKIHEFYDNLDKIRSKMNPDIAKAIDKKMKQEKMEEKDKSLAL